MSARPPRASTPIPARKSLRAVGVLATLALIVYVAAAGIYLAHERERIFATTQQLAALARHEKALALAASAVDRALIAVHQAGAGAVDPPRLLDLEHGMQVMLRLLADLQGFDPAYARLPRALERSHVEAVHAPGQPNWSRLFEALRRASDDLDIRQRLLADERAALDLGHQRAYDAVTVESVLLAIIGLAGFGSFAAWFFTRLARDIARLEQHARHIVLGSRGVAMTVRRDDEIGRLMHAVNRMSVDLDERERQIRLESERRSHHDKMLTVGALAAGVAHEVNNPLAVIAGVADELREGGPALESQRVAEAAALIRSQAERAAQAARRLAEVAAPASTDFDWVDVNALVRHVVQLMGYDRRYRRLTWQVEADPAVPAVRSAGSAVQQVLMQIVSLMGDALADSASGGRTVRVQTAIEPDGVAVQIECAEALDFSRAEVQRSVLLSRAIVEPLRGRLAFGLGEGGGQRIRLSLPLDGREEEG